MIGRQSIRAWRGLLEAKRLAISRISCLLYNVDLCAVIVCHVGSG